MATPDRSNIKHLTDISIDVASKTGLSRNKAKEIINATFDSIMHNLKLGNDVSIYKVGRFKRIPIEASNRLKPNTTEMIHVPAHTVVHFAKSPKFEL